MLIFRINPATISGASGVTTAPMLDYNLAKPQSARVRRCLTYMSVPEHISCLHVLGTTASSHVKIVCALAKRALASKGVANSAKPYFICVQPLQGPSSEGVEKFSGGVEIFSAGVTSTWVEFLLGVENPL